MRNEQTQRCEWAGNDPLMIEYHDKEWGVPAHDDRELFEFLILEGAQAGLSWSTILKRRQAYQQAFDNFNPQKVAKYSEKDIENLIANTGIIRNKLKIKSAINNAQKFLQVQEEFGSFNKYIWQFVDYRPIQNRFQNLSELPASTDISKKMSQDLKRRGFNFVGPTICYAFMQAVGMVNDHVLSCFRYEEIRQID
ncbi:MAG: DNA-3-methyladenine glycosylase I [Promethearchaeota archaeon]